MNKAIHIVVLFFLLFPLTTIAQKTIISGKVIDFDSKKPIPFANVSFKDSKIGTITDTNGVFHLETYYVKDWVEVSSIGYELKAKKVIPDKNQKLDFALKPIKQEIKEIVIKPTDDENPAHKIFRNIIANKDVNNREKLNAYEYEIYNKVEIDVEDLSERFINFFLWRPIDFIFDNIDSISDERPFLPSFMSETVSHLYYRKEPEAVREIVSATEISGMQNESVSRLLGDMYQNVNIYDNRIIVFDRSFVSPLSNQGLLNYRYYLTDSAYLDNKWCYKIDFTPRRKQELTFDGYFWVNDTTYAIKEIKADIPKDINLNFITSIRVHQIYSEVEPEVWMLTRDHLKIRARFLKPNAKYQKFIGRKNTTYKNFVINKVLPDSVYTTEPSVLVLDSAEFKSREDWAGLRHEPLSKTESVVYEMIDTVLQTRYYKRWADVFRGYYRVGIVEFGPYFSTYSYNAIEGERFRFGGRTSRLLNPDLRINFYTAYGLLDEQWKYGMSFRYFPSRVPRQFIKLSYKKDLEQLGTSALEFGTDNLISSASRRTVGNELNGVEEYLALYERSWNEEVTTAFQFTQRSIWPLGALIFERLNAQELLQNVEEITTAEASVSMHLSYKESFINSQFSRTSLGSNYPVLDAQYSYGIKGLFGSDYEYHKIKLGLTQKVRLGILGTMRYYVESGKTFGALPYPLLTLHSGNETYFFDDFSFNLMNYYEFVSDQYVSIFAEHHFQGLFFNKIPLIRKMMLREVITGRGVYGALDKANFNELLIPEGVYSLNEPYYEVSVGIENIFSFIRIDAVWRMNYLDNPEVIPFGFRAKAQVGF